MNLLLMKTMFAIFLVVKKNVEKGERRSQIFESPMISGKRENDQLGSHKAAKGSSTNVREKRDGGRRQIKTTSNNLVTIDNPSSKANIEAVDGKMHGIGGSLEFWRYFIIYTLAAKKILLVFIATYKTDIDRDLIIVLLILIMFGTTELIVS
ncbi:hypothetical protein ACJX0J_022330 [Zea mays]